MFMLSLITFSVLMFGSCGSSQKCPAPENIYPCKCIKGLFGVEVTCSRLEHVVLLENCLESVKGVDIDKLSVIILNASTWETDVFKGLKVNTLLLEKVEVDAPSFRAGRTHFQGLEKSLQTLEINKSFRRANPLVNLRIDHLEFLENAFFENNYIPEIGNDWFPVDSPELTNLIFDYNGIEKLGDQAFTSLTNLKILSIAGNHIRDISRSMLPKSTKRLTYLDLSYNKLRELPVDLFSEFPSLIDVDISHNLLHTLPEDTFKTLYFQGVSVALNGNPLTCDESLTWVCKYKGDAPLFAKCFSPRNQMGKTINKFCAQA